MEKDKETRTSYDYLHNGPESFGNKITVEAGIDDVLQVHIDVLLRDNHKWYLQRRYDDENRDWRHVYRKAVAEDDNTDFDERSYELESPWPDVHYQAFPEDMDEEPVDPRMERMLWAFAQLTQDQRDFVYEVLGANKKLTEIAAEQGVTEQALINRKNKILRRMRKLMNVEI